MTAEEYSAEVDSWIRILAKEPGNTAEHRAFLDSELWRIRGEAYSKVEPKNRTRSALNAKLRSLIPAWHRQYLKNPQGTGMPRRESTKGRAPVMDNREAHAQLKREADEERARRAAAIGGAQ